MLMLENICEHMEPGFNTCLRILSAATRFPGSSGWKSSLGSTDNTKRAVPSRAQAVDVQGSPFPLFPVPQPTACSAFLALCCSHLAAPWPVLQDSKDPSPRMELGRFHG